MILSEPRFELFEGKRVVVYLYIVADSHCVHVSSFVPEFRTGFLTPSPCV